jgi:hypothetical protein
MNTGRKQKRKNALVKSRVYILCVFISFLMCAYTIVILERWWQKDISEDFCSRESVFHSAIEDKAQGWIQDFPKENPNPTKDLYLSFSSSNGEVKNYTVYAMYWTTSNHSPVFYIPLEADITREDNLGLYGYFYTPDLEIPIFNFYKLKKLDANIYCYITSGASLKR